MNTWQNLLDSHRELVRQGHLYLAWLLLQYMKKCICPECRQPRPNDDRVKEGMKCGFCSY